MSENTKERGFGLGTLFYSSSNPFGTTLIRHCQTRENTSVLAMESDGAQTRSQRRRSGRARQPRHSTSERVGTCRCAL